jgi:molybdopterin synthase catalytic subunit
MTANVTTRIQQSDFDVAQEIAALMSRWELSGIRVIHRVGRITPGENIVLVVTASKHRQAAFEAAEFLMDYLKANAPFWKRVDGADGKDWVEARDHDETAAARWTKS